MIHNINTPVAELIIKATKFIFYNLYQVYKLKSAVF